ncbi:hypothetical protein C8F04DRAFT_1074667 [Mycena alexandri]|uniref:Uncharacterized protein n=1 Tax=Mycena alexandri TaxID=1745969 RepID=A0AAD6WVZ3_9AGAR|nr:hypothetical protein C8F04DRAFT_1124377 [Mycena alexandri]KAJ7042764.1 hypothetical protein C8F04DRAFT_1074667 [Mycena alexandri]
MDCQFSFGPNGAFFCKSDTQWAWSDNNTLPEPLRLILEDPNHPQGNQFPYDVALPMEPGMFSMSWKTVKGEDYYEELFLGPRYAKLAEFMRNIAQGGEHTTRTVFGPNASYFTISPSGFSWQNLPAVLEHDIIGRMKKGFPTNVALGVHGAFVVLYGDGNVTFDVATHYPAVDAMIRNSTENARRKGIAFIALNPHAAGQYYVAYGDGSASWNLPNEWSPDVTTVSKTLRPVGAARLTSTLPPLGFAAAAGGTQSPVSPASSGSGIGTQAIHGVGKLWHVYQQQQQGQSSSPFATQTSFFDSSNTTPSFDPSTLAGGFDPSSLVAGLDPNTLAANTIGVLFGN